MSTLVLTRSELEASDGFLCWRPRHRGALLGTLHIRACSLPFAHHGACRFDMTVERGPFRWSVFAVAAVVGLLVTSAIWMLT